MPLPLLLPLPLLPLPLLPLPPLPLLPLPLPLLLLLLLLLPLLLQLLLLLLLPCFWPLPSLILALFRIDPPGEKPQARQLRFLKSF